MVDVGPSRGLVSWFFVVAYHTFRDGSSLVLRCFVHLVVDFGFFFVGVLWCILVAHGVDDSSERGLSPLGLAEVSPWECARRLGRGWLGLTWLL